MFSAPACAALLPAASAHGEEPCGFVEEGCLQERRDRQATVPGSTGQGDEELPSEADGLSKEESRLAAAKEEEELMKGKRSRLADKCGQALAPGTAKLYEAYKKLWKVGPWKPSPIYLRLQKIDISPHAAALQEPRSPSHR